MKLLNNYINIRKGKSIVRATNDNIRQIVKSELDKIGHDADLNYIDVSEVTVMNSLFSIHVAELGETYKDLNPDISKWNVSKVKTMYSMFYYCGDFNQDLSQWDVSNVKDMAFMFFGCKSFNQDLSQWDVSNVEDYFYMFGRCPIRKELKPNFKKLKSSKV